MQQQLTPKMENIMRQAHRLMSATMDEMPQSVQSKEDAFRLHSKAIVFCAFAEVYGPDAAAQITAPIIDG